MFDRNFGHDSSSIHSTITLQSLSINTTPPEPIGTCVGWHLDLPTNRHPLRYHRHANASHPQEIMGDTVMKWPNQTFNTQHTTPVLGHIGQSTVNATWDNNSLYQGVRGVRQSKYLFFLIGWWGGFPPCAATVCDLVGKTWQTWNKDASVKFLCLGCNCILPPWFFGRLCYMLRFLFLKISSTVMAN